MLYFTRVKRVHCVCVRACMWWTRVDGRIKFERLVEEKTGGIGLNFRDSVTKDGIKGRTEN